MFPTRDEGFPLGKQPYRGHPKRPPLVLGHRRIMDAVAFVVGRMSGVIPRTSVSPIDPAFDPPPPEPQSRVRHLGDAEGGLQGLQCRIPLPRTPPRALCGSALPTKTSVYARGSAPGIRSRLIEHPLGILEFGAGGADRHGKLLG